MNLSKTYAPQEVESKWYSYWLENKLFKSVPDHREPYTIVIPPPNVTGVLHMGHMLNNTIQDVLIRRNRMLGKNACWVPGTDHASIATEAKVVAMLKEKGIDKKELSRSEFLKYAWEWKEKYGGIILEQLKKLGASCDWDRTRFTMEDDLSDAVIDTFIDLFNKGLIYRGVRMVNWDPAGKTAVSDEEVIYKEVQSKLYYVKYQVKNSNEFITVATTRPETILGDTGICVNPTDERYSHLIGKTVIVPIIEREVPIIADDAVDTTFGTGALKVTPAHDIVDYELGVKYNLPAIDVIATDGTMAPIAQFYVGMDRFVCRKTIAKDLAAKGYLVKEEDITNKVGYSERTNAVIEPKLSMQWFCKMQDLAKPALEVVLNDEVKLIPEKFKNTYKHWMENCKDWCVSRQLWWGQQIPAWYNKNNEVVVCKTKAEAVQLFLSKGLSADEIRQDEDVLDTWFSSWLWPISVFDGFKDPNNADINYYYPTNDLVTAPEILFFWVARMIMAGIEFKKEIPFKNVYLTGIVRDKLGRKMSKSLGNSPDPIDLINQYGADGVRVGMLLSAPAGNDLLFDESYCEQGRNFANKIWNAYRLVKGWNVDESLTPTIVQTQAIEWFQETLNKSIIETNELYHQYKLSDVLMNVYKLVWDDFCSSYLEMIKPAYGEPINASTYEATLSFFRNILKLLHPFMPFITEELWEDIKENSNDSCLMLSAMPSAEGHNQQLLKVMEHATNVVGEIRTIRNQKQISPKEQLVIYTQPSVNSSIMAYSELIEKLANVAPLKVTTEKPENTVYFRVGLDEFYVVLEGLVDKEQEMKKIQEEIKYLQGFLTSVNAKLSNEKFMANAKPEIVANERKKQEDAQNKLKLLEDTLVQLGKTL